MKKWILWNNGDEPWPEECVLQFAGGDAMGNQKKIKVPALAPKNFAEVEIQLESPSMPGMYKSQWRTCTPSGSYFGGMYFIASIFYQPMHENILMLCTFIAVAHLPPFLTADDHQSTPSWWTTNND